ncbi:hypothetical protein [Lewinella sp. LCG006]|uniref:hypothetical protein n=1 Tax=Lewinella sp. LCG006 TaxID=3231911 RepID=UPI0034615FF2
MMDDKVTHLISTLSTFQERFVTGAYSTMGIYLLILGWILTSNDARAFLNKNAYLLKYVILLLAASYIFYVIGLFYIQSISAEIVNWLHENKIEEILYKHYVISFEGTCYFAIFQLVPNILIVLVLIGNLRNKSSS